MKTNQVVAAGALSIAICLPGVAMGQGLYLGGAIGSSSFKQGCDDLPAGLSCKKTDSGWKGFAGYQITRNWGLEAGYAEFGKATTYRRGDEFSMKAGCRHIEDIGPQGVSYLVGRRPV